MSTEFVTFRFENFPTKYTVFKASLPTHVARMRKVLGLKSNHPYELLNEAQEVLETVNPPEVVEVVEKVQVEEPGGIVEVDFSDPDNPKRKPRNKKK